jgi:hypothetical protein
MIAFLEASRWSNLPTNSFHLQKSVVLARPGSISVVNRPYPPQRSSLTCIKSVLSTATTIESAVSTLNNSKFEQLPLTHLAELQDKLLGVTFISLSIFTVLLLAYLGRRIG